MICGATVEEAKREPGAPTKALLSSASERTGARIGFKQENADLAVSLLS